MNLEEDNTMNKKIMKNGVDKLQISKNAISILEKNNIQNIEQLCKRTRKELKEMNILQVDIRDIVLSLQLVGLDLKNNSY